jgi:secondary thiamine-phosphate synthase enzyme
MVYHDTLEITTQQRGMTDLTAQVNAVVQKSGCQTGLCHLFIQHTSASLVICENYDPLVKKDLETFMGTLVADGDPRFEHTIEGPDDMSAHIRTILTETSISIPIINGKLALGTWQGIYAWEHRLGSFSRKIIVTILGE